MSNNFNILTVLNNLFIFIKQNIGLYLIVFGLFAIGTWYKIYNLAPMYESKMIINSDIISNYRLSEILKQIKFDIKAHKYETLAEEMNLDQSVLCNVVRFDSKPIEDSPDYSELNGVFFESNCSEITIVVKEESGFDEFEKGIIYFLSSQHYIQNKFLERSEILKESKEDMERDLELLYTNLSETASKKRKADKNENKSFVINLSDTHYFLRTDISKTKAQIRELRPVRIISNLNSRSIIESQITIILVAAFFIYLILASFLAICFRFFINRK